MYGGASYNIAKGVEYFPFDQGLFNYKLNSIGWVMADTLCPFIIRVYDEYGNQIDRLTCDFTYIGNDDSDGLASTYSGSEYYIAFLDHDRRADNWWILTKKRSLPYGFEPYEFSWTVYDDDRGTNFNEKWNVVLEVSLIDF